MHELAVTEGILKVVREHAERAEASRIIAIDLVIGDLSGFVADSIQFYFDILARGTVAEGAQLRFQRVKTRFRCWTCGDEFTAKGEDWRCPQCQSMAGKAVAGKEFYVESIDVERDGNGGR